MLSTVSQLVYKEMNVAAWKMRDRTIDEGISDIFTAYANTGKIVNEEQVEKEK